jgi:hypothetical protein
MKNQDEKPVVTMVALFKELEVVRSSIERTNNSKSKGGIVGPKFFENKLADLKKQETSICEQIAAHLTHLVENTPENYLDEIEDFEFHKGELNSNNTPENNPF